MLWYYEDEGIIGSDSDIKYDAEVMDSFTDALCRDIDNYRERTRDLERGYVKYHNNETFVGEMADRSKEFTYDVQGDIHEKNLELKKEFLNMCLSIENKFKEEVDPSPKARVSVEGLTKIKKDFNVYLNALDAKGYELECHAKEAADILGRWGVSSVTTYRRAMEVCDEFCGQGKSLDKDIKKLESFDQEACALIDSKDLTGYANDLQRKIKYTAGVLDSMTVYQPSVAKNSVGVVALNAKSALSMWSNPFAYPFFPMISDDEIMRLAKMTGATVEEIKQIVVGYIPQNVSNETVICVMSYLAEKNTISNKTIKKHSKENLNQIAKVYSCGNYIENQMFWEDVKYGNKDMAYSGCEIIAVVNALHSMGKDLNNEEVAALISKFEADGAMLNGTWGTCPNKLADYLVEDAGYNVKCTSSTDYNEIEEVGKNSDTIIVTLYNDDNDILAQIHTINIEKQTDANGNVVYIGHNTAYYDDINGDNDGVPDNNEMIPSKKYSSLEDAIKDASHGNNSAPIMVMGISAPCQGDFPESETKAC